MPARIVRAWRVLTAPPVQERIYLTMYIGVIGLGFWIITDPPMTVEGWWGSAQTTVWGLLLAIGGVLGACTVRTKLQYVERAGLLAIAFFLLLYALFLIGQHFMTEGSRSASIAALFLGSVAVSLRAAEIWKFDYAPPRRERY